MTNYIKYATLIAAKERNYNKMQKSLYSLMLSDDVVSRIDMLALKKGTNRSNIINMILAEYLSLTTPEMRIENVFRRMESLFAPYESIATMLVPNRPTLSVKSTLDYKYRPTVKYDVRLYKNITNGAFGELAVSFRTQSQTLIDMTDRFFRFWSSLENKYIKPEYAEKIQYSLIDGRFTRTLMAFYGNDYSADETADALTCYITCLDRIMKATVEGKYSLADAEEEYKNYLKTAKYLI